jgi:hypothetical protein
LPGKSDLVREYWKKKAEHTKEEQKFWQSLKMTSFDSWLQSTPQGDFMIHCLEGESLQQIFKGLREQIVAANPIAVKLQKFYQEVLGKDYSLPDAEPRLENLQNTSLPVSRNYIKRAFFAPLLPGKEEAHRQFRKDAMGAKKERHEASLRSFGVFHLSVWLQTTPSAKYLVVYTERDPSTREQKQNSPEWKEIAAILMDHTGLSFEEISPNVEWLTQSLSTAKT